MCSLSRCNESMHSHTRVGGWKFMDSLPPYPTFEKRVLLMLTLPYPTFGKRVLLMLTLPYLWEEGAPHAYPTLP